MTSIVEVIQHYQRSIDSSQDNEARLLHCINKLYKLPIKVEHLQETGVGKTVNSLRKFNGEIGVAAKTLVTKWKAMVAAEEEPMDTSSQNNENETPKNDDNDDAGSTPRDDEDDENLNRNNTSQQLEKSKHRNGDKKDKSNDRHKERSSSSGHKDSKSSSSSHHHGSEKSSKHSSDKHKTTSSSSSKDKEMQHKSSSDHSSSSNNKDKEREKEKTDHKSRKENHIEKDDRHDKDKKREEKSKKDKEHKTDSNSASNSSHHKNKSHSSSSSSKSKHDDSHSHSASKEKERSDKQKGSSKDKERPKDEKSSSHSSSKDKPEHKSTTHSSTSKSSTKDSESSERKRRHNSDDDSTDFKSPQPKVAKTQKPTKLESSPAQEEEEADDCFDSSMGANFDDVLGMLNMPKKKSKKSLKSPTTPSNGSSSSSKKESTPHKPTSGNSSSGSDGNKLNGSRTTIPSSLYSTPSTSKSSTMKPDLLAPTAKLEPLDPSIVFELPTISTNYKPMPLNQTVMDCVFNNSSNSKPPVRTLTDAEAMSHGISSKTIRTKIYSGVRTGQTYQVPTLFDMCIRILQKNIDALEYTGGVPFEVLKPVLERATPQQLYVFEEYNPYLMEDSDVLWQQHVSRSFRTKKRLENESWREMFIRCQEEEERRLSVLKDSIKASQKIAAAPVRKTQLAFVDSMVKPPRNVLKKQEQYGTKSKLVATPAARVASLSSVTPNAAKTGDQRLRVAATVRDHAQVSSSAIRTKKAPLMQKTLQFIRGRHKR